LSNTNFELRAGETVPLDTISVKMTWTDLINIISNSGITIEGGNVVAKATYVYNNMTSIISKLDLNYQYITQVNGFAYKSEKVKI
jgi:hypothetical protein